jgi:tetratricopeptide (TPR) repeat protein
MSPVFEDQPIVAKSLGKTILVKAVFVTLFVILGFCLFIYFDSVACSMYYTGHPDKALGPTKRALWVQEHVIGHDSLETANTRKNLARVYDALGRFDEAEPLFAEAMKTYVMKNAQNTLGYSEILCFYGDHQMSLRKYDDSLNSYREARKIMSALNLTATREFAWTLQRVANALKALNRRDEAAPVDAEANKILGKA